MTSHEIKNLSRTNHIRKHPEWLFYHGLLMMMGGIGSFAFHASFTNMAHLIDIVFAIAMISYPMCYSFINICLEEMNRFFWVGDVASRLSAPCCFIFSIFSGGWIVSNRKSWTRMTTEACFGIMVGLIVTNVLFKFVKERLLARREYTIKGWIFLLAFVSFGIALVFQEEVINMPSSCMPGSGFQLHALWHFFASLALFSTMMAFRTEEE